MVGDQVLLVLAAAALGVAGWRAAAACGAEGTERVLSAVPLAALAAALEALALGAVDAGGDRFALAATALATGALAVALLPRPAPAGLGRWWTARSRAQRWALGAGGGGFALWEAWVVRRPALGLDGLTYHLPEALTWIAGGRPGTVRPLFHAVPFGNFPRTHELLLTWLMGISRSFAPVLVLAGGLWLLLALAVAHGLRRLGVATRPMLLGAGVVVALPVCVTQLPSPDTDLPALAWLACSAALCAGAGRRPGLLAGALAAAGLAAGTKTTALPLALVVLAAGAWTARASLRPRGPALVAAVLAALAVSAPWYLANWIRHGWPLWPFTSGPSGDPIPAVYHAINRSFLSHPEVVRGRWADYGRALGGGVVVLAGALAAPLLAERRRRTVGAALALTLVAALLWAASPWSGGDPTTELAVSAVRYALPVVLAATVTLALATRGSGAGPRIAEALLAGALAVDAWRAAATGFPLRPPGWVPLVGALLGALLVAAPAGRVGRRLPRAAPGAAALVGAVVALTVGGAGFVARHAATGGYDAAVVRWFVAQPAWQRGAAPISGWPDQLAVLAGDGLDHATMLIADGRPCAEIRARARTGWVVLQAAPNGDFGAYAACLADTAPVYADASFRVWRLA